jgi:hypothetical protein
MLDMSDIRKKINEILLADVDQATSTPASATMVETFAEYDYEELYTDIFVMVHNIDDFYGDQSHPKAALLLESFLLESLVLLKRDPEVVVVESGDDYVRATSFTPDGEAVVHLFEDVVLMNTMLELYNQALMGSGLETIDIGIGMATFPRMTPPESDFGVDDRDDAPLDEEWGIDFNNTAMRLALIANSEAFDVIIINDMAYDMMEDVDKEFFTSHLEASVIAEEEMTIYHGNIVANEE